MEGSDGSPATSRQTLGAGDNESATSLLQDKKKTRQNLREMERSEIYTISILCFVNLINYMDRFTIAGNLGDIKETFKVKDDMLGLLQTVFVIAYMIFAPIFGYLGDRYSRRHIMVFGVTLWALFTFLGSFVHNFYWFMFFRCVVGIGEASYSTIAPTIISDLFVGNIRSKMLAIFYFAIPVGSGMGYIVGAQANVAFGSWRWGLRVTPVLGIVAVLLIWLVMAEPERGQAEESHMHATSYKDDLNSLIRNPSFMLSTLAFTCVAFVTGALAWWGPQFIYQGLVLQPGMANVDMANVSFKFGLVAMFAGAVGVPLGSYLAQRIRITREGADPLICAFGLLTSTPLIFFALVSAGTHIKTCYFLMFFGEVALNLSWSIIADILLYVVIPPRRSTAEAMQILISHMFGDAGSPYLIGLISEMLKPSGTATDVEHFRALQYALFVTCFVEVIGGIFFFLTSFYIVRDKMLVDRAIHEPESNSNETVHHNAQDSIGPAPLTGSPPE